MKSSIKFAVLAQALLVLVLSTASFQVFANQADSSKEIVLKLPLVTLEKSRQMGLRAASAHPEYYKVATVEVTELSQTNVTTMTNRYLSLTNDCATRTDSGLNVGVEPSKGAGGRPGLRDTGSDLSEISGDLDKTNIILDQIINMGAKIWNLVKKSRPIVNVKTVSANALPKGAECWDQMENWKSPRSAVYRASYKNLFGYEVVRLDVRVIHAYGGQYNGQGRYITNAMVQYRDLRVAPGMFEVNAAVEVPMVLNVGTKANPVAALQMSLNWMVRGVNEIQQSVSWVVFGDGRPTEVHN